MGLRVAHEPRGPVRGSRAWAAVAAAASSSVGVAPSRAPISSRAHANRRRASQRRASTWGACALSGLPGASSLPDCALTLSPGWRAAGRTVACPHLRLQRLRANEIGPSRSAPEPGNRHAGVLTLGVTHRPRAINPAAVRLRRGRFACRIASPRAAPRDVGESRPRVHHWASPSAMPGLLGRLVQCVRVGPSCKRPDGLPEPRRRR